jgi:hypothetical protein
VSEYAVPAVAPGREAVLMLRVGGVFAGVIVSDAWPDLVGSALLVAVTVALSLELTTGAVYRPLALMVPLDADQVTATFDVLLTVAVNCTVFDDATVAVAGVTVTLTEPPLETVI